MTAEICLAVAWIRQGGIIRQHTAALMGRTYGHWEAGSSGWIKVVSDGTFGHGEGSSLQALSVSRAIALDSLHTIRKSTKYGFIGAGSGYTNHELLAKMVLRRTAELLEGHVIVASANIEPLAVVFVGQHLPGIGYPADSGYICKFGLNQCRGDGKKQPYN